MIIDMAYDDHSLFFCSNIDFKVTLSTRYSSRCGILYRNIGKTNWCVIDFIDNQPGYFALVLRIDYIGKEEEIEFKKKNPNQNPK